MLNRNLGNTGIEVRAIGLGGMPLSIDGRPEERQALAVLHAAFDAGTNFIDTADVYCLDDRDIGHNERLIAKALSQWRSSGKKAPIYVATKGGLIRPKGDWKTNATPAHLRKACEASLLALGVEQIFLYQLHAPDDRVPFEDSVGELKQLQSEGKILHVGLSNVTPEELLQAQKIVRIETVQNRFNPFFKRDVVSAMFPTCEKENVTYIAHSPCGGWRSHKDFAEREVFRTIAERHGVSPYAVMLGWALKKSPVVLPIPGASRIESARDSASAAKLELTADDMRAIDQVGAKF